MSDRKICDCCKKLLPIHANERAYLKIGMGNIGEMMRIPVKAKTSDGKEIATVSRNCDLCFDCYYKILALMSSLSP